LAHTTKTFRDLLTLRHANERFHDSAVYLYGKQ
jgi:hypothetical protein